MWIILALNRILVFKFNSMFCPTRVQCGEQLKALWKSRDNRMRSWKTTDATTMLQRCRNSGETVKSGSDAIISLQLLVGPLAYFTKIKQLYFFGCHQPQLLEGHVYIGYLNLTFYIKDKEDLYKGRRQDSLFGKWKM